MSALELSMYRNEKVASGGPPASASTTSTNTPMEAVTRTVTDTRIATPANSETPRSVRACGPIDSHVVIRSVVTVYRYFAGSSGEIRK